jgi:uncharacterized membrane protein YphA (DoxX/SURF4 family)
MFFNMTGAVASHLAVGDPAVTLIAPIISPPSSPPPGSCVPWLAATSCAASSRSRAIAYWVTTGLLALECGVGGVMGALRIAPFSEIMKHPGYPAYFMTIIGVWYVLGAVALLVPRFPRLKEWAYAGIVFIYTGAVASRLAGDRPVTLVAPIIFTPSWSPPGPCARRLSSSRISSFLALISRCFSSKRSIFSRRKRCWSCTSVRVKIKPRKEPCSSTSSTS